MLVDNEDRAVAVQKAKAKLAAVPDLAGFFGVYALNGPCCANAVKSAGKTGKGWSTAPACGSVSVQPTRSPILFNGLPRFEKVSTI